MFLFHGEIIFCSRYLSFSIFNYPMIYQICDIMIGISTWDRAETSKFENIDFSWVSWVVLLYNNIYSGLKRILSVS